jgi:hypothetical protein
MRGERGNNGWLRDPANRPWIVLGLAIVVLMLASGLYAWITRVQPVIDRILEQVQSQAVLLL